MTTRRTARARFRCRDCKALVTGDVGDDTRRACHRCGGQIDRVSFKTSNRRKR